MNLMTISTYLIYLNLLIKFSVDLFSILLHKMVQYKKAIVNLYIKKLSFLALCCVFLAKLCHKSKTLKYKFSKVSLMILLSRATRYLK